jgi:hypothetical protein
MTQAANTIEDASLDLVSGGVKDYSECPLGTMEGGGPGLYPNGSGTCYDGTNRMAYGAFFEGFNKTSGQHT